MNNIIKQLKRGAKNTRLSSVEKTEMKSALLGYVKAHPASQEVLAARGILSPFVPRRNKRTLSFIVAASLLVGSSVSFAAEGSLPGDILYPVKVGVNEPVLGAVAITPAAKAAWNITLVERRLVEVEKLAVSQNVSSEVQQAAATNLAKYTHDAEERLETVEDDNDGDEAINNTVALSDVLTTHEQILSDIHSKIMKVTVATPETKVATTSITMVATTTPAQIEHNEHVQSVEVTIQNIRTSIKHIDVKNEELKKKFYKEEATSTTPVVAPASVSHTEVPVANTALPVRVHADEHNAVIENHHEHVVATSTTPVVSDTNNSAPAIVAPEVHNETHTTSTSTESRHRDSSHTENTRTASSTSERD